MHVSYSTVRRLYSKFSSTLPRQHGGCPTKLTPQARCLLARKVTSGVAESAPQLKRLLDLNVTTQTIRNMLKREGLKSAVKKKRPCLSSTHRKVHLEFALKHKHWTPDG